MEAEVALLALLVGGYALIAARLERFSVGRALVLLVIGIVDLGRRLRPDLAATGRRAGQAPG